MEEIKRLPRSVHSTLRSGVILCDLPRVVEELVYNSLDAGATKVIISIGIGACYLKVEDDGCGITRDGLVILGERYATSKLRLLAEVETSIGSLGFRGESLCSLTDVSLVEVRTKARGKPNSYCKILKGSKCLFIGIDDQREGVGTTVIARDLFYNQPVRRKYMQSSTKKVLYSVKKCILRIALVNPQVSFKLTDIEREDELLSTIPSSSPLPLVSDGFGKEVSDSLHEVVFSDGILTLTGYTSGPRDSFSTKAFQYVYINSRFICKGPIHNLLNNLAASFLYSSSHQQFEPEFHGGKRQKSQGFPAYMLNLCCPISSYDLNFGPSKTIVEFKDWENVLSFFSQAVRHFWKQLPSKTFEGTTLSHSKCVPEEHQTQKEEMFATESSKSSKMRKRKSNIELHHRSLSGSTHKRKWEILSEDRIGHEKHITPPKELFSFFPELEPSRNGSGYIDPIDDIIQNVNNQNYIFSSTCNNMDSVIDGPDLWSTDVTPFLPENKFFPDQTVNVIEKYNLPGIVLINSSEGGRRLREISSRNFVASAPYDIINDAHNVQYPFDFSSVNPGTRSCCLMESKQDSSAYNSDVCGFNSEFNTSEKGFSLHDIVDDVDDNYCSKHFNFMISPIQTKVDAIRPSSSFLRKCIKMEESNILSTNSINSFSTDKNRLQNEPATQYLETGSRSDSHETEWLRDSQQSPSVISSRCSYDYAHSYTSNVDSGCFETDNNGHFPTTERKVEFMNYAKRSCREALPTMSCTRSKFSPKRNVLYGFPSDDITFIEVNIPDKLDDDEAEWLKSDSSDLKNSGCSTKSAFHTSVQDHDKVVESPCCEKVFEDCRSSHDIKVRSRRSSSAPPFYRGKRKFFALKDHAATQLLYDAKTAPETSKFLNLSQPCCVSQPQNRLANRDVSQPGLREYIVENQSTCEMSVSNGRCDKAHCNQVSLTSAIEESVAEDLEYAKATLTKWRSGISQPTDVDMSQNYTEQMEDILSVSSGLLHFSGSSLIPESISKDCLQDARVLLQLDKKFIPVMADAVLAIIDQHAADERIRLEELRRKVLSGEGSSITYLEFEQELVLPEMGFQLLQKYEEQLKKWGWICNMHSQCSASFGKNMKLLNKHAPSVTLVAVPCILGINLTDKDLIEFIEQLVQTDGSSTLPPSVLRVLNFKACRGAIMFGDSLLPSECSLIVEELKETSLCFQCAHGRPTTVPLLNMASLREQLARLEMQKGASVETWHGFRRHRPSVKRSQMRLDSAKRFCNG